MEYHKEKRDKNVKMSNPVPIIRRVKSMFPHTSFWISEEQAPVLYTVWLEGDSSPYEIKSEKTKIWDSQGPEKGRDSLFVPAYFTSMSGYKTPSLYLAKRDSYISNWQVPVDVGNEKIIYRFPLEPDYKYELKAVAYQQKDDKWKTKVTIDGDKIGEIEYEPYKPETLECLIPESFYKDSVIEVTFKCDDGEFAAIGPVYIYRYEYGEGGKGGGSGPMSQGTFNRKKFSLDIFPNPFNRNLNIKLQSPREENLSIKVYDVSGRLVKNIYKGKISGDCTLNWKGNDENGRSLSQGVYFLRIRNLNTDKDYFEKIIKLK